ncbi:hypothetical protein PV-S19_0319 [Pacmanvirus S19]|nr:hypothetical protein PV-S19_0319 [Pacmanvirus S19]
MLFNYANSICAKLCTPSFKTRYKRLLESTPLTQYEKDIINERYIRIVTRAELDYRRTCIMYILLTNIITVSGVLITGFVSLNKIGIVGDTASNVFFWIVFVLSVILTLSNKFLYSFNIHKKYVLNIVILEKFYSEGWSFISGINRYAHCVDYTAQFKLFCSRIERIKLKSLESLPEMNSNNNPADILATGSTPIADNAAKQRTRKSKNPQRKPIKKADMSELKDNIMNDGSTDFNSLNEFSQVNSQFDPLAQVSIDLK